MSYNMSFRKRYTINDEHIMWLFILEKLDERDRMAYYPKGLKLWEEFLDTGNIDGGFTVQSLSTHFRKYMYHHIEKSSLTVEQQVKIAAALRISVSLRQQKM
uniref:Uncharacterized protein n=1 Tax=Onchocerca volvulus TaxID=6282 RepID=A0A8R1TMG4_ONCVO